MRYSKVLHDKSRELDERFLRRPRNKILLFCQSCCVHIVSQKQDLCNYLHVTLFDVAPYIVINFLFFGEESRNAIFLCFL